MPRHSAIYVRISSKTQDEASQLPDLERWAKAQEGPVVWYRDRFTGKTMARPGWGKLETALRRGEVSRIVVWRLDRLGRTAAGLTALFHDLVESGIGLLSMREGLDLTTPAGRLMCHVIASVSQYESEVRGERQRAGIEAAKSRGVYRGRKKGTLKADPARARALRAKGLSIAEVAASLSVSEASVFRYLRG